MTIQNINVGQIENDGTGDDLREAFVKVNQNFTNLLSIIEQSPSAVNLGNGVGIYKDDNSNELKFKSLVSGAAISIISNPNDIVISVPQLVSSVRANNTTLTGQVTFLGQGSVTTQVENNTIKIVNNFNNLEEDTSPTLGNNLDANNYSINNLDKINNVELSNLDKILGNSFYFGNFINTATNIIDWIILNNNVDMGSFLQPNGTSIDMGAF